MAELDNLKLIHAILGISRPDVEILKILVEATGVEQCLTVREIACRLGKSRSSVERSVRKLLELGIVKRRVTLSRGGGYVYCYTARSREEVEKILLEKCRRIGDVLRRAIVELLNEVYSRYVCGDCTNRAYT